MDKAENIDAGAMDRWLMLSDHLNSLRPNGPVSLEPLDEGGKKLFYVQILVEMEKCRRDGVALGVKPTTSSGLLPPSESLETLERTYPATAKNFVVLACKNDHLDLLDLLLRLNCPAKPDDTDEDGFTALHYAFSRNNLAMLKRLLNEWPTLPIDVLPDRSPLVQWAPAVVAVNDVYVLSDEMRVFLQEELQVRRFWKELLKLADFTFKSNGLAPTAHDILDAVIDGLKAYKRHLETFLIANGLCFQETGLIFFCLIAENYQRLLNMRRTSSVESFKKVEVPLTRLLMPLVEYRRFEVLDRHLKSRKMRLLDAGVVHSTACTELRRHLDEMTAIRKWFKDYRFGVMQQRREMDHLLTVFSDLRSDLASLPGVAPQQQTSSPPSAAATSDRSYDAYCLTKDIVALDTILKYVDLASSTEVRREPLVAPVVIERAVQVLGEYCKDYEGSPHLTARRRRQLAKAGLPVKQMDHFRNLLSHCTLTSTLTTSDDHRRGFLEKVQEDLHKIRTLIVKVVNRLQLSKVRLMVSELPPLGPLHDADSDLSRLFTELQSCKSVGKQKNLLAVISERAAVDDRLREMADAVENIRIAIRFAEVGRRLTKRDATLRPLLKSLERPGLKLDGVTPTFVTDRDSDFETISESSVTAITYPRGIEAFVTKTTRAKARVWQSASDAVRPMLYDVVVQTLMEEAWPKKLRKKMKLGFKSPVNVVLWKTSLFERADEVRNELADRMDLVIALERAAVVGSDRLEGELEVLAEDLYVVDDRAMMTERVRRLLDVDDGHAVLFLTAFGEACARLQSEHVTNDWVNSMLSEVVGAVEDLLPADDHRRLVERVERQKKVHNIKRTLDVLCDVTRALPEAEFETMIASLTSDAAAVATYSDRRKCKTFLMRLKNTLDGVWSAVYKGGKFKDVCDFFEKFARTIGGDDPSTSDVLNRTFRERLERRFETYYRDTLDVLRRFLVESDKASCMSEDRLLYLYHCDANMRAAVEMLVLRLLSVLNEVVTRDGTAKQLEALLYRSVQRLLVRLGGERTGRGLLLPVRNYLAHGDAVVDLLDPAVPSAVALTAFVLAKNGPALMAIRKILDDANGRAILKRALLAYGDGRGPSNLPTRYADGIRIVLESEWSGPWKDDLLAVLDGEAVVAVDRSYDFRRRASHLEMVGAARLDHSETLQFCVDHGVSVTWTDDERWTLLHFAADAGSLDVVRFLLNQGALLDAVCRGGYTPLHLAVFGGHVDAIGILLETGADVDAADDDGRTAMHSAAANGYCGLVQTLIGRGASVKTASRLLVTPLHLAARNGHSDVVAALLKVGADKDALDAGRFTPLFYAALEGHVDVVRYLLDEGCSPAGDVDAILSPLHVACIYRRTEVVRLLADRGADVERRGADGRTPLFWACLDEYDDVVDALLENGANVDGDAVGESWTVLHLLAAKGMTKFAEFLVSRKANVEAVDGNGKTALHYAATMGHVKFVQMLLAKKANVNATSVTGVTPLLFAVDKGHRAVVQLLSRNGADVEAGDGKRWPLLMAASRGDAEIVRSLLQRGARVDRRSETGLTALHQAAYHGNVDSVMALLDHDASTEAVDHAGATPLHCAVISGHLDAVDALLLRGADVDATIDSKISAMHLAVQNGRVDVLRRLLDGGAPHRANADGYFPLHAAVLKGSPELLETLLQNGVDVDTLSPLGKTGLHLVSEMEENPEDDSSTIDLLGTVRTLIAHRTDVNARDFYRRTPLHFAAGAGNAQVVILLLENGADPTAVDGRNETPLWKAIQARRHQCRELLTAAESGTIPANCERIASTVADVARCDCGGGVDGARPSDPEWAFRRAVWQGDASLVRRWLREDADRTKIWADNHRLLHFAAAAGDEDVVRVLLKAGARIDVVDVDGRMPLHVAAFAGHIDLVRCLLDVVGAEANSPTDGDRRTVAHFAAEKGDTEMLKLLMGRGVKMDVGDVAGVTPLYLCSSKGLVDAAALLLDDGCRVDASVAGKDGPIHGATLGGHAELVRLLLTARPDAVGARGNGGRTPLHGCASVGDLKVTKYLLGLGADPNVADDAGRTSLHVAAQNGNPALVALLLEHSADPKTLDNDGRSPLHEAVAVGHYGSVEALIEKGADVKSADGRGDCPLVLAVREGHDGVVDLLLSHGAEMDVVSGDGWTLVHLAVLHGDAAFLKFVLERVADVDCRGQDGLTPLHLATSRGLDNHVRLLCGKGARANVEDASGDGPLHLACRLGFEDIATILIDAGADVEVLDRDGLSPMTSAASGGHLRVVDALMDGRAALDAEDGHGQTALHVAVKWNLVEMVEHLLKKNADVNRRQKRGASYLHTAALYGLPSVVSVLLQGGLDVDVRMDHGITPLHVASCRGHVDVLEVLLQNDADLAACDDDHLTALHQAIANHRPRALQHLRTKELAVGAPSGSDADLLRYAAGLSHDPAVTAAVEDAVAGVDCEVQTLLHIASRQGSAAVVATSMAMGARSDVVDGSGATALCRAAAEGHLEVIRTLLDAGADVNFSGGRNCTALHWAALHGHLDVVVELVRRRAVVDALDGSQCTPLLLAVQHGHREVARFLLQSGADVNARGDGEITTLSLAVTYGDVELVQVLVENGADVSLKNKNGHNALQQAVAEGHLELTTYFLATGSDADARMTNGATLLHIAACGGWTEIATLLLDSGAEPDARSLRSETPLHMAAFVGSEDVARVLLTHGADPNAVDDSGRTVLHYAAMVGRREETTSLIENGHRGEETPDARRRSGVGLVRLLIGRGAMVNVVDEQGFTALHQAAYHGDVDAVEVLMDCGADVGAVDDELQTPLHHATLGGCVDTVQRLIIGGAVVDAQQKGGPTPAYLACSLGNLAVLRVLLDAGASASARSYHDTMLHASADSGAVDVVRAILGRLESVGSILLEHVDVPDGDGDTPLMRAVQAGAADVAELLLLSNADVGVRNHAGDSALDCALRNGFGEVAEVLRRFGANTSGPDRGPTGTSE